MFAPILYLAQVVEKTTGKRVVYLRGTFFPAFM